MGIASKLIENNIRVIHQTGESDYRTCSEFYEKNTLSVECFAFKESIVEFLEVADFAVSRAGASTLWELSANLLPALFVPYPYAAKNHQYFNAKIIVDKSAALLELEENLDEKKLWDILKHIDLEDMSKKLSLTIRSDGAKRVADEILKSLK